MPATAIYRALVAEIERRRVQAGWTMLELDAAAGLQSGYWAKCVHVDAKSGRQARWDMLEFVMGALFPDGYDLALQPHKGPLLNQFSMRYHIRNAAPVDSPTFRQRMSDAGKLSACARLEKMTPAHRRRVARKAAKARWRQEKFKHAPTGCLLPGGVQPGTKPVKRKKRRKRRAP